jgi:altronate dehydratase large subunit
MNSTPSEQLVLDQFEATTRGERGIGIRDRILVLPSVICSHLVADRIAEQVSEAVSAPHDHGCAQLGADNEQTERTLVGVGQNPNIAGTVVVGLGCEEVQSSEVAEALAAQDVPVDELSIQGVGGTDECIAEGEKKVRSLVKRSIGSETVDAGLGDLTVGVVSGDLRSESRSVADPLVGEFVDMVIGNGGRVVIAGTERLVPHADSVLKNTADGAQAAVKRVLERDKSRPPKDVATREAAAECSFDEITRTYGGRPIESLVEYGQPAAFDSGVALLDSPTQFEEAATGLAAAGAHLVVHVTTDGVPTGHPIVPTIKITGNESTAAALEEDIDIDATSTTADELKDFIAAVADGQRSSTERHGLSEFAITRVGPSM